MNWSRVRDRLSTQQADESKILRWAQSASSRQSNTAAAPHGSTSDREFGIVKKGQVNTAIRVDHKSEAGEVYELVDKSPSGALLKVRYPETNSESWLPVAEHERLTNGEFKILSADKRLAKKFVTLSR